MIAVCLAAGLVTATKAAPTAAPKLNATTLLSPGQALRARASALRRYSPSSKDAAAAKFNAGEQRVVRSLIAGLKPMDFWLLRKSISESRQYVVVHGKHGYTGWANPFTSTWVVGMWKRIGAEWRLNGLYSAMAPDFGQAKSDDKPGLNAAWLSPTRKPAEALVDEERAAVTSFKDSAHRDMPARLAPSSARARTVSVARQAALLLSLIQARERPGYQNYSNALAQLFGSTADSAAAAVQKQLAEIPDTVRSSLVPVMAIDQSDGLTFVTQSPQAPGLVVFVHFAPDATGHPQPVRARMALLFSQRTL
jgi:hypothetical protein